MRWHCVRLSNTIHGEVLGMLLGCPLLDEVERLHRGGVDACFCRECDDLMLEFGWFDTLLYAASSLKCDVVDACFCCRLPMLRGYKYNKVLLYSS